MSDVTKCDGCGHELRSPTSPHAPGDREPAITGQRVNAHAVGSTVLPRGKFDLCSSCAIIGFEAIKEAVALVRAGLIPGGWHPTEHAVHLPLKAEVPDAGQAH